MTEQLIMFILPKKPSVRHPGRPSFGTVVDVIAGKPIVWCLTRVFFATHVRPQRLANGLIIAATGFVDLVLVAASVADPDPLTPINAVAVVVSIFYARLLIRAVNRFQRAAARLADGEVDADFFRTARYLRDRRVFVWCMVPWSATVDAAGGSWPVMPVLWTMVLVALYAGVCVHNLRRGRARAKAKQLTEAAIAALRPAPMPVPACVRVPSNNR